MMVMTCSAPGGPGTGFRPTASHALLAGLLNASLLAIPLWLLILRGLGVL